MDNSTIALFTAIAASVATILSTLINFMNNKSQRKHEVKLREQELNHEKELRKQELFISNQLNVYKEFVEKYAHLSLVSSTSNSYMYPYTSSIISEFRTAAYRLIIANNEIAINVECLLNAFDHYYSNTEEYSYNAMVNEVNQYYREILNKIEYSTTNI